MTDDLRLKTDDLRLKTDDLRLKTDDLRLKTELISADRDFVSDPSVAGMAEVELGRMATERAANPEVKKFDK